MDICTIPTFAALLMVANATQKDSAQYRQMDPLLNELCSAYTTRDSLWFMHQQHYGESVPLVKTPLSKKQMKRKCKNFCKRTVKNKYKKAHR